MKKRITAVVMAVLMGMSATACSGQNEVKDVNRVSVSGIFPETGDVIVTNTYIGTVAPKESITVYPMKSGNVTEVSASVGKQVKKGDVLFKIDSKETDLEIADAEAELEKMQELAEQAKEDAEALEEALAKVEGANEKAVLETELKALQKDLETAEKKQETAQDVYDTKKYEYNKTSSSDSKLKDEKKESMNLALDLLNDAKADVKEIEEEIKELEAEIKALDTAAKSTTSKTTTKSSTTSKSTSTSSSTSTKSSTSKTTTSKDSDDKTTDSKTTDKTSTDSKTTSTVTGNTVYDQMVEDAQQKVEDAKAKLELYQISAPIDGTIEAVYIETNEKAFEEEPCLVLSNKSNIEVTFQVPEAAALELRTGDKIKVEKNGAMNEASITEVAIMADTQTKLFTVKASLGTVSGFSTGTDVKVYAETKKANGVMRLPYDTLYFQGDTAYVYCVVDDEAVRKTVQVGLMNDEYAQILDGLSEEDIVISTWSSQLKDGTEVDLLFVIGGNTVDVNGDDASEEITQGLESIGEESTETEDKETEETEETEEEIKWVLPELD